MRVGILGGGLHCVALSLAERGIDVTLFDRSAQLLSRTAVANEGKIHLGNLTPPEWPTYPSEPLRSQLLEGTLNAMSQFVLSLRDIKASELKDITVKGGVIVAWGQTDIYDPASELHRRFEIGITSKARFHSIDPGKLTMAPYFADVCTARILEGTSL
jgi:glycine/D-amino acid oxidase-like deaminating enzyme